MQYLYGSRVEEYFGPWVFWFLGLEQYGGRPMQYVAEDPVPRDYPVLTCDPTMKGAFYDVAFSAYNKRSWEAELLLDFNSFEGGALTVIMAQMAP